jgi:hypothetical protein
MATKTKMFLMAMDPKLFEKAEAVSIKEDRSIASFFRMATQEYIERHYDNEQRSNYA